MEALARHRLIEAHLPLVRALARRYAGGDVPFDDLVQVGAIGLIKAVDRYDAQRCRALAPYAVPMILGEIRHHLRDSDAPVRVPRRTRSDGVRVRFEPLADAAERPGGPDPVAAAEDRVALRRAMRALAPRERRLLALRYFGDLSQAEVAAALGISPVHVSRLLHRALDTLRAELEGDAPRTAPLALERDAA